jgi:hypothetical protein
MHVGHSTYGKSNKTLPIALALVVIVGVIIWFAITPNEIGLAVELGANIESAEKIYPNSNLEAGGQQKLLLMKNGAQLYIDKDAVLEFGDYLKDFGIKIIKGRALVDCATSTDSITVSDAVTGVSAKSGLFTFMTGSPKTAIDVFKGEVTLSGGKRIYPGLTVLVSSDAKVPTVRGHVDKIGWIGESHSDPKSVRPAIEDTNLPGMISGMIIENDSWQPSTATELRLLPDGELSDSEMPQVAATDNMGRYSVPAAEGEFQLLAKKRNMFTKSPKDSWDRFNWFNSRTIGNRVYYLLTLHKYELPPIPIKDAITNLPITGVKVTIIGELKDRTKTREVTVDDPKGFRVYPWPNSDMVISAEKEGYRPVLNRPLLISFSSDEEDELDITMSPIVPRDKDGKKVRTQKTGKWGIQRF